MNATNSPHRIFISHSSKDKQFVRRLANDLRSRNIDVWFDERDLKVGDSIVKGISDGLNEADYLIVVLSKSSTSSRWVQAELNTAIMDQLSGKGVVVLPILIEDCQIPALLKDRVYADFRTNYAVGLETLLEVFRQEESDTNQASTLQLGDVDCFTKLSSLSDADLRRLINDRVKRNQVSMLWFDTLGDDMEDHLPNTDKLQSIIQLLIRVKHQGLREKLITNICKDLSYTANPLTGPSHEKIAKVAGHVNVIFSIPYSRNPFFTGRTSVLNSLHNTLNKKRQTSRLQSQAICGLGGVGKTQTAIEYAYRYCDEYKAILWIKADSHLALSAGFLEIATLLGLPEKDAESHEDIIRAVKLWLDNNPDWLVIFDNADDIELLKLFWPLRAKGHILLTSRAQIFDTLGIMNPLEIKVLLPNEALQFLLKRTSRQRCGSTEKISATKLAKELGYLPLALEQAGAFIRVNKARFQDYLTSYRELRLELLKDSQPLIGDYQETVLTTWAMNFDKVLEISEAASDLLRATAFLSPDSIPLELIQKGAPEFGPILSKALEDAEKNPIILNQIIEPLTRYSLISSDAGSQTYSIHRLVQEVLTYRMDLELRYSWAERVVRALARSFPHVDYLGFQDWPSCELFLPHAKVAAGLIDQCDFHFVEAGTFLNYVGFYCFERARYAEAEPMFKKSLEILEAELGPNHLEVAKALQNLARLYYFEGQYSKAEDLCQRAFGIKKGALKPNNNLELALTLNVLALTYLAQGKYKHADPLLRQSVEIRERALGPESPYVAGSLNDLGFLCSEMGKFSEAEGLHKRALQIRKQALGPEHHLLARSFNNLALLYLAQKRYREAEPLFKRALEIREKTFGPSHPDVSASLNNLGTLYREEGHYKDAEDFYKRSLEIRKSAMGNNHPGVALILNNLAYLYYKQKKYAEAEPLYRQAIEIQEKALRGEHPYLAYSLHDLGLVYLAQKKYEEAEPLFKRALEIREKTFGHYHISIAQTLESYAKLVRQKQRNSEAVLMKSRAKKIRDRHTKENT